MSRADIIFTIPGEPVPQGRPRFSTRGGFVRAIDPEKSRAYKQTVATLAEAAMRGREPLEGAVGVSLTFFHAIPKSFTKGKRLAAEHGILEKTTKPDTDNCIKAVTDAVKGIAWRDDAQIVYIAAEKHYGKVPQTLVRIWPKVYKDPEPKE